MLPAIIGRISIPAPENSAKYLSLNSLELQTNGNANVESLTICLCDCGKKSPFDNISYSIER